MSTEFQEHSTAEKQKHKKRGATVAAEQGKDKKKRKTLFRDSSTPIVERENLIH